MKKNDILVIHKLSTIIYYSKYMNLLRHSFQLGSRLRTPLSSGCSNRFSEYFQKKDSLELAEYMKRKLKNKYYRDLIDTWKKPLEKKRLRQERIKQIKKQLEKNPPKEEQAKLIIHNPAVGIQYPPAMHQQFAVIKIDDRQYKVTEDCVLLLDTKQDHQVGDKIIFDNLLMIGTSTYTLLGRPMLGGKVEATIESISQGEKVIVFKKKRRKQYKKSFGFRAQLTSVRIDNIFCEIPQQAMERAVAL